MSVERENIRTAVDLICTDLVKLVMQLKNLENKEIYFEDVSLPDILTPFETLEITRTICNRYKLNYQIFVDLEAVYLPIRYLGCYILLNSEEIGK